MEDFNGIIISINQYKDSDAIANLITENGLITFIYKNAFKINNSKKLTLNNFLFGTFTLYKGPLKYFQLKDIKTIKNYFSSRANNLITLLIFDFISELTIKTINEDEYNCVFNILLTFLKNIDEQKKTIFFETIAYFYNILKIIGIGLEEEKEIFFLKKDTYDKYQFKKDLLHLAKHLSTFLNLELNSIEIINSMI